jgi:hypothetical protein
MLVLGEGSKRKVSAMPLVNVRLIEGVFTPECAPEVPSVCTSPGAMVLTLTPPGPYSAAHDRVRLCRVALVAL